jgi:hypothetical protein
VEELWRFCGFFDLVVKRVKKMPPLLSHFVWWQITPLIVFEIVPLRICVEWNRVTGIGKQELPRGSGRTTSNNRKWGVR